MNMAERNVAERVVKHSQHAHSRIKPVPRAGERRGLRHGVSLLPSLFTIANLFCGWACVVYAMRGDLTTAAPFVGIAIVLDMLDGRIARMTGTTSEFGVQLDSLADLISFGMAPAILAFQWGLLPLGRLGWAVGFLFVTAAALRLARFNIQTPSDKRYFVGMPSPAAAAVPAATVFFFPDGMQTYQQALPALAVVLVPALLMVSTIRYRSFKTIDLGTKRSYRGLILLAALIAAVASHPHEVLLAMAYAYLASAFIGLALQRFRGAKHAELTAAPSPPVPEPPPGPTEP
jgi:CDP-diacylglycerol---serine O-phosphatidyltransferase